MLLASDIVALGHKSAMSVVLVIGNHARGDSSFHDVAFNIVCNWLCIASVQNREVLDATEAWNVSQLTCSRIGVVLQWVLVKFQL